MAYKTTVSLYCANRAAALTELWSKIEAMGWVIHDNLDEDSKSAWAASTAYTVGQQVVPTTKNGKVYECTVAGTSGETQPTWPTTEGSTVVDGTVTWKCYNGKTRVYKSNGEAADRINEYIKIDWITANQITLRAYYYWNATTHTGVGVSLGNGTITTAETGFYLWIHGNKDLVILHTKVSTTYDQSGFGHLPKRFWTSCLATTQTAATAGTNVVVEVNNTTNFRVGKYYQIVGAAGEGRDRVQVTAINPGVSLTIASLPRDYGAGAMIGNAPSTFGNFISNINNFNHTCPYNVAGTAAAVNNLSVVYLFTVTNIDPDERQEGAFVLQPVFYGKDSETLGYSEEYLTIAPSTGLVNEDIFGVSADGSEIDNGTSTGANTSTTLNDTTKNWPVNGQQGKVLLITGGTGSGQIRKISSNTATQLSIAEAWVTIPDATSTYAIRDEGWRLMPNNYAVREAV